MNRLLLPLLVVLVVVLVALSMRGAPSRQAASGNGPEPPRYTVENARWQRFDEKGQALFEATASSIDYYDDESARLHAMHITALAERGKPWHASSPEGHSPAGERRVQLTGGVDGDGQWPDGEPLTFTTPDLWVDTENKRLDTDSAVHIESATRKADAIGMNVDGKNGQIHLRRDVRMRYVLS